jgi:thiamine-monophosphate kinase
MAALGEIGEHEAVRRLTEKLGPHPDLSTGTGDDCAVVVLAEQNIDQVFTTDPVIEGVHFDTSERPERIGNKAAGRVLSDLAAMGARPQWLLVNVVAAPEQSIEALEAVYDGLINQCRRFGAVVVGGDLTKGPCLELHVFGVGSLPAGKAMLRSGAQPGDHILVTGLLGGSLESGRHLDFIPRVEEGLFLRETGVIHSMMDISDGLATDLRHLMYESGVGAVLEAESIPANGTVDNALYDGEDFELLFTVSPDNVPSLRTSWVKRFDTPLCTVGVITAQPGVLELRSGSGTLRTLEKKAFEHFSPKAAS